MQELSQVGITTTTTTTAASTRLDSKASAMEAKEEKAQENATSADQPGISRESALNHTRAKAKAKVSKESATVAEKLVAQPTSAQEQRR